MTFQSDYLNNAFNSEDVIADSPFDTIPENEKIILIDPAFRKIRIPNILKNIAVVDDNVSETVYFQIPRYVDNKDLSEYQCVVRIINAGGEYVECETIDTEVTDDFIGFGWVITNDVTKYPGDIEFTIQFEDGNYQWQTTTAKMHILNGISSAEPPIDPESSAFKELKKQVILLQTKVAALTAQVDASTSICNELNTKINALQNNVAYISNEGGTI